MKITADSLINIILPSEPTPRDIFAAEELKKYLGAVTGAAFSEKADCTFIIGGPKRNRHAQALITKEDFSSLMTGEEGILIEIKGDCALIAGSEGKSDRGRGVIYAVYEFLERYCGCNFAGYCAPGIKAGETVPKGKLDIPDGRYVKGGADLPYRTAIVEYGECAGEPEHRLNIPFFDWLIKNRYNRILTWSSVYETYKELGLVDELQRRGIELTVGHHGASRLWLPPYGNKYFPEKYALTHPEYYKLGKNGERIVPVSEDDPFGQLLYCNYNEECIAQIAKNIIAWIDENPAVDTVAMWPNDGVHDQCACERCASHTKAENYTRFLIAILNKVNEARPHVKLDMLTYVDLWKYTPGTVLPQNLIIDQAMWANEQRKCGAPDGSAFIGTEFERNILEWKAAGAKVVTYDYYMGVFGNRQRIVPMADEIQSIFRRFRELDIMGAGTQIECFNVNNHIMNLYTFGRTGYDTSLSFEDNLRALTAVYGEGAPMVADAIREMENALQGEALVGFGGKYMIEHVDKAKVYGLFEQALDAATDAVCRNNIRLMRMAFRYSEIECGDPSHVGRTQFCRFQDYGDPTGELAFLATSYDSFLHNDPGYGIAFPLRNTDTKDFVPDKWYAFEE